MPQHNIPELYTLSPSVNFEGSNIKNECQGINPQKSPEKTKMLPRKTDVHQMFVLIRINWRMEASDGLERTLLLAIPPVGCAGDR